MFIRLAFNESKLVHIKVKDIMAIEEGDGHTVIYTSGMSWAVKESIEEIRDILIDIDNSLAAKSLADSLSMSMKI